MPLQIRPSSAVKRRPGRPRDEALSARRKDEILDAAARVFADLGYRATDLQVIADQIGVAKGTLYRYFPSKCDLFLAAVDRGMNRLLEYVETNVSRSNDFLEMSANAIRSYLAFFDANPEFVELLIQERAEFKDRQGSSYFRYREDKNRHWQELYRGLIEHGCVRDMPVERITDVVSNLLYGTMFTNYFAGRTKSLEAQTNDMVDIVWRGILVDAKKDHNCE